MQRIAHVSIVACRLSPMLPRWNQFPTLTLPVMLLAVQTSCMVGPTYEAPQMLLPDSWHAALLNETSSSSSVDGAGEWWSAFDDPAMLELIERAERNNLKLRTMVARIDAARAQYGVAGSDLYPQVDATGQAIWYREGASSTFGLDDANSKSFSIGPQMSWEVDLWGRVRRTTRAAEADVVASVENWRDALITVRAEVASSCIAYRLAQQQLEIATLAIVAARIAYDLDEQSYAAGVGTKQEVLSAHATMLSLESDKRAFETNASTELNRLSILIGEAPGALRDVFDDNLGVPVPPLDIAVALPATVIRHRPDVRAAERQLAAAVEILGATEALKYPTFQLSGQIGLQSSDLGSLFNWSNRNWSIGPAFSWSILNWGKVESQIQLQEAVVEQQLVSYQSAVLGACQDVENAIVGFANAELSRRDTLAARDDSLDSVVLELQAFEQGTAVLDGVVQTELQYLQAEYALLTAQGQVAQSAVILYKSIGGDWRRVVPGDDGPVPVTTTTNENELAQKTGGAS